MKKIQLTLIVLLVIIGLSVQFLYAQNNTIPFADFYVSTQGNDNWSGKLTEPNANKTDGPFATINKAKKAVRIIKKRLLSQYLCAYPRR